MYQWYMEMEIEYMISIDSMMPVTRRGVTTISKDMKKNTCSLSNIHFQAKKLNLAMLAKKDMNIYIRFLHKNTPFQNLIN